MKTKKSEVKGITVTTHYLKSDPRSDYANKLDVIWLCGKHHGFAHRKDVVCL